MTGFAHPLDCSETAYVTICGHQNLHPKQSSMHHLLRKYFSTLAVIPQEKSRKTKEQESRKKKKKFKREFLFWVGECTSYEKTSLKSGTKNFLTTSAQYFYQS